MAAEVILVIEDDVHIGGLVVQVLREAGFAPALVRDVRAARDWRQEGNTPAAVPGPAQLTAELAEIFQGAPLALMTGVPPRRRAALGVIHERIIEKPFELEALIATIHSMITAPQP